MTPIQLIVVHQNSMSNSGPDAKRDVFDFLDVENLLVVKDQIRSILVGLKHGGHVLAKHSGKMYVCELNNIDPEKDYDRHEVTYHPHQSIFTI